VPRTASLLVGIILACLCGCSSKTPQYGPNYALSDEDIAAYARRAGQQSFRGPDGVIGTHHGTRVVADFHSTDGGDTVVIVRYDVDSEEACKRAGGVVRTELVPVSITAVDARFCVPKVLVDRHIQASFNPAAAR
jgi:hypothetical protein